MDCSKCAKDSIHCGMGMGYKGTSRDCPSFEIKPKQLYSEPLPYDIDDVVYYMEKVSEVGGQPNFKLIKCCVYGYYNFGDGWKLKLHTNRNKFKYAEYNIPFSGAEYVVFKDKKRAEKAIRDLNGHMVD